MSTNPEAVIHIDDPGSGLQAVIVIDSTVLGPALGGARMLPYGSLEEAEEDARRLARGMTLKNAVAGLPFGGGKSAIIGDPQTDKTPARLEAFGKSVEKQRRRYITSADMNIHDPDLRIIARATQYVAGFDSEGEVGKNPSPWTALGVFEGIRAAAIHQWDSERLQGAVVAIQGLGEVGMALAGHLHQAGAQLIVADLAPSKVDEAVARFSAQSLSPTEILTTECDILSPCARGGILSQRTIPSIKASIIAGCANNQLWAEEDGQRLLDRGILYAPDYVINAGGAICVAGEIQGWTVEEIQHRTLGIHKTLLRIFELAKAEGCPTAAAADRLAEGIMESARTSKAAE